MERQLGRAGGQVHALHHQVVEEGSDTKVVADDLGVTQRLIQWLWAEYLKTGMTHIQGRVGRPKGADPSNAEAKMMLDARRWLDG